MKSTPPMALSQALSTSFAVSPIYLPTRFTLLTSTTLDVGSTSMLCSSCPIMRATVVLPVPGLPVSVKFVTICDIFPTPMLERCFINMLCTASLLMVSFTERMPTNRSMSASTSSNGLALVSSVCGKSSVLSTYISSWLKSALPSIDMSRWLCFSIVSSKSLRATRAFPKFLSRLR